MATKSFALGRVSVEIWRTEASTRWIAEPGEGNGFSHMRQPAISRMTLFFGPSGSQKTQIPLWYRSNMFRYCLKPLTRDKARTWCGVRPSIFRMSDVTSTSCITLFEPKTVQHKPTQPSILLYVLLIIFWLTKFEFPRFALSKRLKIWLNQMSVNM